jgi:hypothetical protein
MARWNIGQFVENGTLLVGDRLIGKCGCAATITATGILLNGQVFKNLSPAATAANLKCTNKRASLSGPVWWKIERLGKTFDELGIAFFQKKQQNSGRTMFWFKRHFEDVVSAAGENEALIAPVSNNFVCKSVHKVLN